MERKKQNVPKSPKQESARWTSEPKRKQESPASVVHLSAISLEHVTSEDDEAKYPRRRERISVSVGDEEEEEKVEEEMEGEGKEEDETKKKKKKVKEAQEQKNEKEKKRGKEDIRSATEKDVSSGAHLGSAAEAYGTPNHVASKTSDPLHVPASPNRPKSDSPCISPWSRRRHGKCENGGESKSNATSRRFAVCQETDNYGEERRFVKALYKFF